eukprot:Gb_33251 [translate_table: standard]
MHNEEKDFVCNIPDDDSSAFGTKTSCDKVTSIRNLRIVTLELANGVFLTKWLAEELKNFTSHDMGLLFNNVKMNPKIGDKKKLQGLFVTKLVRLFSKFSSENEGTEDPYGHVGSILVNISRMEVGRKLLLDPKRSLMNQVIRQIDSPNPLRRNGVSGTIRNCYFEAETQLFDLLLTSQFLWPALLLPLIEKQVYSKEDTDRMSLELANPLSHKYEPEKDPKIQVQVVEAIYMIAMQEARRRALCPRIMTNMVASRVGIKYSFKSSNHASVVACATEAHSIGDTFKDNLFGNAKFQRGHNVLEDPRSELGTFKVV